MQIRPFRNRKAKKDDSSSSSSRSISAVDKQQNDNVTTTTKDRSTDTTNNNNKDEELLPSKHDRVQLQNRLVAAAASVYIRHSVNASIDLDGDTDLSKEAKAKKRSQQQGLHDKHKRRLQVLLGANFFQTVSACLLLPKESQSSLSALEEQTTDENYSDTFKQERLEDVFGTISLFLCNYILATATATASATATNNKNSGAGDSIHSNNSSSNGYDARIRNIIRIACIALLADYYEAQDSDGTLLAQLKRRREMLKLRASQFTPLDSQPTEGDGREGSSSSLPASQQTQTSNTTRGPPSKQLSVMLENEYQKQAHGGDKDQTSSTTDLAALQNDISVPSHTVYNNLYRQYATWKFQALEQAIADNMFQHLVLDKSNNRKGENKEQQDPEADSSGGRFSRQSLTRAAKIGGIGVVAGTLFAVTGGIAAPVLGPSIAAGLAAVGVGGTAVVIATSHIALVTLFGIGGGGLSAYKMKRRTDGLSEFVIHQETTDSTTTNMSKVARCENAAKEKGAAHLHTTVCVSGWLVDEQDFQRPWGVTPENLGKLELLQRFFSVVDPSKVKDAKDLLAPYDGSGSEKEQELWETFCSALKEQYGKCPNTLLPMTERACRLSSAEMAALDQTLQVLLKSSPKSPSERPSQKEDTVAQTSLALTALNTPNEKSDEVENLNPALRVWDYKTQFGGDMYTVRWESQILLNTCDVVNSMAVQVATTATKEVLKNTALATIMTAVAWPSLLVSLAGSIDSDWALVVIRSDLAGIELAKSLLLSEELRPVNLIGYSFGGRVICACLQELARHQSIWEERQQEKVMKQGKLWNKGNNNNDDNIDYKREPASIVQDVVIMGTPLFVSRSSFRACCRMVAGRFVNCYSPKDWVIALMFQYKNTSSLYRGNCATGPIDGVSGIENYDVSEIVSSWHANYCTAVPDILDFIGFDQPMPVEIEQRTV